MARVALLSRLAAAATTLPFALIIVSGVTASGCARLHARTIGPPLETPSPPPRTIPAAREPIESQPIVASPPVGEVQSPPPPVIKQPAEAPPAATTPAPAPATPPAVAERPPAPAAEPPTLQSTTNPTVVEQRTRVALANANRDLGRIDVRSLSSDARAQYDIARRYIAQANDALNTRNFEFAQQLADKAATLAALLQRR